MKEFIEKLIKRLEDVKGTVNGLSDIVWNNAVKMCIREVNELAEEYQNDNLSQLSNKYWKCLIKFGVDITEKWETATQNAVALEQAYMRGRQDEINRFTEEYESWVIIDGQYCWQTCGATEHCKECRRLGNCVIDYYENMGEYINCSTDASTKSTDCSTKVSEMPTGWISVSERLPIKANHNVLVTYKDRYIGGVYGVCEGQYVHSLKEWQITDYAIDDDFNVIAWCEKPAPYTEGE